MAQATSLTSRRATCLALFALTPLLLPAVAQLFTDEVKWTGFDFVVMGSLLLSLAFGVDLAWRTIRGRTARLLAIGGALLLFLLVWVELAVGVFGTPFAGS